MAVKFSILNTYATPGAIEALRHANVTARSLLARHFRCDWGDVCPADAKLNDEAMKIGGRLLSSYIIADGVKVWVITEADRSSTTLLLPDEY